MPPPTSSTTRHRATKEFSLHALDKLESKQEAIIASSNAKSEPNHALTLTILELCLCGAFASAIGDFVMHPVDTIKVFQQTSKTGVSLLAAVSEIWTKGGLFGFYPGVGAYVFTDSISGAIKFAVFEITKAFTEARVPSQFHPFTKFICAAGAMIACSVALVPGEVIKVRLQSGECNFKPFSINFDVTHNFRKLRLFFATYCVNYQE